VTGSTQLILRAYTLAVGLYPHPFRAEFATEMQQVFADACEAAAEDSPAALWAFSLRELRELPFSLVKEHLSKLWRKMMLPEPNPSPSLPASVWRSTIIFAASFFAVSLFFCLLDAFQHSGQTVSQFTSVWDRFIVNPFTLEIALGAAVLVGAKKPLLALLAALGSSAGYLLVNRIGGQVMDRPDVGSPISLFAPFVYMAVLGAVIVGLLGLIQRGWRSVGTYALFGGLGFIAGWFGDRLVAALIISVSPFAGWLANLVIGSFWYFLYMLIPSLLLGAIVGLFIGLASTRSHETPAAQTA
jgi:hypothetical protein